MCLPSSLSRNSKDALLCPDLTFATPTPSSYDAQGRLDVLAFIPDQAQAGKGAEAGAACTSAAGASVDPPSRTPSPSHSIHVFQTTLPPRNELLSVTRAIQR